MQAWGILACLMLTAVRARSHYVVLIPAELRTDTLENVCVLILSATESSPLTLTIENEMTNSTLLQQELLTNTGYNCFNFTVGNEVMGLDTETIIAVTVRRSGETVFINETKRVVLKRYDSLTFIQTDKAVYKPGQAVKFRIVTLNENFIPIQEKYPFVTVLDPQKDSIGQWKDVEARQGIADLSFELMPEPIEGSYIIEVKKFRRTLRHEFTVEQHFLPQYEITLEFPEIITFLQEKIQVKVCARYINGYPVSGFVNGKIMFKINDLFEHFLVAGNLSNGCSKMEILIQPFNLYSRKCAAFFEITDAGTGNLLEKSAECKIVKKITKMAFEDVEQYYKTGIPYRGQIRMQYSTGGPVSNVTIYLFNSMVPGAEKVITDENGIASFSLDTSSWGSESVSLSAMYQFNNKDLWRPLPIHGKARHTAKLFYSRSNSYFSISKHRQELVCDSELDVNVDYIIKALSAQEKHDLDVFYLVMSRGLIVTLKKKTISVGGSEGTKGHLRLSLLINADISPVARLLVFTVLPDGETIGDSAKFQVSKCFRNKVSLHFSVAEDLPKSHVSLDVHAAPDSLCGLRVVDRSVLLLKPEMELSRDSVYSLLPVLDLSGNKDRDSEDAQEFCRRQARWSEPVSMDDAIGDFALLLQDMGLKILTDTEYQSPIECRPSSEAGVSRMIYPKISDISWYITERIIQKHFPETWIWDLVPVGPTGSVSLPLTVPDAITEWQGSMFCTGKAGFGISETISLNAFKPFRVDLALPSSIARTQEFTLMAKVLNYLKKCIMVKVTLLEHQGFDMASESSIENQTCVCSMESVIISWHLNATGLGEQNLTVKAESIPSDSLCGNEVAIVPEKGAIDIIRKPLLITMKPDEVMTISRKLISNLMTNHWIYSVSTDDWDEYGD